MTYSVDTLGQHHVIDRFDEAIILTNKQGVIVQTNKAAKQLFRITNLNQQSLFTYLNVDLDKDDGQHTVLQLEYNEELWVNVKVVKLNKSLYFLVIHHLTLDEQFAEGHHGMRNLIEGSEEGMLMYHDENIIDSDYTTANMFNYSKEQIKALHITKLFKKEDDQLVGVTKDGATFPVEVVCKSEEKDGKTVTTLLVKDISNRVNYAREIEALSYYDKLTQLPNEDNFVLQLDKLIAHGNNDMNYAVYNIKLHYFQGLNDTLGYGYSDKLIKACSQRLVAVAKQRMAFIAHVSGDEFLIFQENINEKADTDIFATTLIRAFKQPLIIDEHEVHASINIGISVFPGDGQDARELVKHANSAMYFVNEEHRNSYNYFNSALTRKFKNRLTMVEDLRQALELKQFILHYQPQVNTELNSIVGVEALIRWNHPSKGMVSPLDFISLAEKTGLIIDIGYWVLLETCRQNIKWMNAGYKPINCSVNISAKQLLQPDFIQQLKRVLDETRINPKHLELEITESIAISNEKTVLEIINEIRKLDVAIVIDDFGTGYSSLKYLSLYPINKVKIDKMFVQSEQMENKMIVKAIVRLSHALNMKVIAEGVETKEQLNFLKSLNCDQIQGFYFSKPLSAEKVSKLLQNDSILKR